MSLTENLNVSEKRVGFMPTLFMGIFTMYFVFFIQNINGESMKKQHN